MRGELIILFSFRTIPRSEPRLHRSLSYPPDAPNIVTLDKDLACFDQFLCNGLKHHGASERMGRINLFQG